MKKMLLLSALSLSVGLWAEQARPPVIPWEEVLEYTDQHDRPDLVFDQYSRDLTILQNDDAELLKNTYTADSMIPYIRMTMACYAIENNRPKCLEVLIQKGFDPEFFSQRGDTPMVYAARRGYVEMIRVLAKAGADVNKPIAMGTTNPLLAAAEFGQVEAVKTLLELGADVNYMSTTRWFPAAAVAFHDRDDVLAVLIEHGADINKAEPQYKKTALMTAAEKNAVRCVKLLLASGVDKHAKSVDGWTAADFTHWKYYQDSADCLKLLVEAGVGLQITKTPWALISMAKHHSYKCLEYALSLNLFDLSKDGANLYDDALQRPGSANTLRVLRNAKVPTSVQIGTDSAGKSYHHVSHEVNNILWVWTYAKGADKESLDLILSFAKESGEQLKLDLFKVKLDDKNAADKVRWMLACGADPRQRNANGETFRDVVRKRVESANGVASPILVNLLEELNAIWPDDNLSRELTVQSLTIEMRAQQGIAPYGEGLPFEIQFYPAKQPHHVLLKMKNKDKHTTYTFENFQLPIREAWQEAVNWHKQHLLIERVVVPPESCVTFLVQFTPKDPDWMMPNSDACSKVFYNRGQAYWVSDSFDVLIDNQKGGYRLDWKVRVPPITFPKTLPGTFKVVRVLEGEE
jgi:ankyrin repeat protein